MDEGNPTKKKLLIADDEPNIRLLIRRIFEKDYTVFEAENGRRAVDLALRHIPDIILMDVMMPESDGLAALNELKATESTKAIPVIMITGVGHELNERLAKSVGAKGYIRKPVKPQELFDAVSTIIRLAKT